MYYMYLAGGFNPFEKYDFVSWDDEIPNIWKVIRVMFQTTNQVYVYIQYISIPFKFLLTIDNNMITWIVGYITIEGPVKYQKLSTCPYKIPEGISKWHLIQSYR